MKMAWSYPQPQRWDKSISAHVQRLIELQQWIARLLSALLEISGHSSGTHCKSRHCPSFPVQSRQSDFPPKNLSSQKVRTANVWGAWNPHASQPGVMIVPTWFSAADIKWNGQPHRMHQTRSHTHLADRQRNCERLKRRRWKQHYDPPMTDNLCLVLKSRHYGCKYGASLQQY